MDIKRTLSRQNSRRESNYNTPHTVVYGSESLVQHYKPHSQDTGSQCMGVCPWYATLQPSLLGYWFPVYGSVSLVHNTATLTPRILVPSGMGVCPWYTTLQPSLLGYWFPVVWECVPGTQHYNPHSQDTGMGMRQDILPTDYEELAYPNCGSSEICFCTTCSASTFALIEGASSLCCLATSACASPLVFSCTLSTTLLCILVCAL